VAIDERRRFQQLAGMLERGIARLGGSGGRHEGQGKRKRDESLP